MTWIQLANEIMAMPTDVLHQQACVWLPKGNYPNADEFPPIVSLTAFDADDGISVENFASIDIDRGAQW